MVSIVFQKKEKMERRIYLNAFVIFALIALVSIVGAAITNYTLTSPSDNARTADNTPDFNFTAVSDVNDTFSCEISMNSTGRGVNSSVLNNTATIITANSTLAEGVYVWHVECTDAGNMVVSSNKTLTIDNASASSTLNSPEGFYNSSSLNITFNCTSADTLGLANVTLYGNWSAGWNANESKNVSGTSNTSTFSKLMADEGKYVWSCYSCDAGNNCSFASNRTFLVDHTDPDVISKSPVDEDEVEEGSTEFVFNVTDGYDVKNCSLFLNDEIASTDTSITENANQTISKSITEDDYEWYIGCWDYSGNYDESSTRDLAVTGDDDGGGGSGGDSSESGWQTATVSVTFTLGNMSAEKTKSIANVLKNDSIKFSFLNENHTITVKSISANSTTIEINSTPITATINVNETKLFDLNGNNLSDFSIRLVSIKSSKANFAFAVVEENASLIVPANNTLINATANSTNSTSGNGFSIDWNAAWNFCKSKWKIIACAGGGIIIIIVIAIIVAKAKHRKHHYWKKSRTSWHKKQKF